MNKVAANGCLAALLLAAGVTPSAAAADQQVLAEVEKEREAAVAIADDIWAFRGTGLSRNQEFPTLENLPV